MGVYRVGVTVAMMLKLNLWPVLGVSKSVEFVLSMVWNVLKNGNAVKKKREIYTSGVD